jgi:hypothetical protein
MRLGYKLALLLAITGAATFAVTATLDTCVHGGSLGSLMPSSPARVPICGTWLIPVAGESLVILGIAGIFLIGISAIVALDAWHPKPTRVE